MDVGEALDRLAPAGVDLMFDNVGGEQLNQVLGRLAYGGRVVLCGGISRYESASPTGPANYFSLIPQHGTMSGFIAGTYAAEFPIARARLLRWLREGKISSKIDVTVGLENGPEALMRIFVGANFGKQVLEVAKP
ncbi:zinc-binding dehydrogenase [Sphingopyxis kveilinensis]|uniref:zinc-binding dehydrogenase n=1 Tax=Sphingopyxis kveilinensis TaxID=3114367 RepID=UPI003BB1B005